MDTESEVLEPVEIEQAEGEETNVNDASEAAPEDDGFVVEIGGAPDDEPEHITDLRKRYREQQKRIKELEATTNAAKPVPQLRAKPTAEDHDYDNDAFAADLEKWFEEKREQDERESERKTVAERAEQRWQQKLSLYDESKEKLGASDYDDAEAIVGELLAAPFPGIVADDVRLGIIKQGAKDPAALVYALGKNPAKAKELAAIEDPVEFAWKAAALESSMKVVRGKAPPPERKISGAAPGGALDNTLERLREEAAKTGDFSKVMAYKRQQRA
jgi:hypothetical protein